MSFPRFSFSARDAKKLTANRDMGTFQPPFAEKSLGGLQQARLFNRALADPGNSRDKALTIKNFPYDNEARIGDDENGSDFYKIKQTKDKKVKFTIDVENNEGIFGPSLTFALQNKNGKTLASDKVSGTDEDRITENLKKGTYYIKVSTDGESVPYEIEVRRG